MEGSPRPLRIAYLHYLLASDTALGHVDQFAAAARALGHRVDIHAMNPAVTSTDVTGGRAHIRTALKRRLRRYLHEPKELLSNAYYITRETRLLASSHPDVLLVRNQGFIGSCGVVGRRLCVPVVLEMNAPVEEVSLYLDEYLHVPWLPVQVERWKMRRVHGITVVSSALKRHVVEQYGAAREKVTVVPNGADVDLFRPDVPADPAVATGAPGVVVGFVGSFSKWHGTALLAEMVRAVGAARPTTRFLLVGDGPEAGEVRALAGELGDRLIWMGRVPHARVPGLVASLDIGVMPESNFYGSPLKVIEWMAAARAIVAPGYAPLSDIIDHSVHGLLFQPGNLRALIASVIRLIDEPRLRESLGRAAAVKVRAELSWTDNARRVLSVCQSARLRYHSAVHRDRRIMRARPRREARR